MSELDLQFTPENLEIVFLSFEGPDQPYAQAGGLGVRVSNFTRALARAGFVTHLFFVGDPDLPDYEPREDGRLHLRRWSQWVSAHHRAGVYDGEIAKVHDYQDSVPSFVTDHVVRPAVEAGRKVAVIAEDWHTGDALARLSDSLNFVGLRGETVHALERQQRPVVRSDQLGSDRIRGGTSRRYLVMSSTRCERTGSIRS